MIDQLFMKDLAYDLAPPLETEQPATLLAAGPTPNPKGQVSVSGITGQQVATDAQQGFGVARPIPQNKAQEALGYIGELLTKAGVQLDKVGVDIPALGRISLKDLTVGESGKVLEDMALGFYPIEGAGGFISGTTRIKPDEALELLNIAPTVGAAAKFGGKAAIAGATKAVQATKGLPVGMSIKDVGQGVDELGFYSAAKQAVDAIQQTKGTGDQFLKQIEKTPGVKPDEIKWTGLDEFLKSKKSVTKAEVQEYLDKNRVEIKEVKLGEPDESEIQAFLNDEAGQGFTREEAIDYLRNDEGATKFSKYTLPGGENYREVLLTLPTNMSEYNKFSEGLTAKYGPGGFSNLPLTDVERARLEKFYANEEKQPFTSQHFDQPNILAHLRVNDRVDADGKKVLFVEEIQSDWHQAGRKQGYKQPDLKPEDVRAEYIQPNVPEGGNPDIYPGYYEVFNKKTGELVTRAGGGLSPERAIQEAINIANASKGGVPDAPFKTTWSELAMKRAIQMASEGGYDRIAFTTGKTQAERFDLSKEISDLTITRNKTDFSISAVDQNGNPVIGRTIPDLRNLDEYVGKDLAEKVKDDFANKSGSEHVYSGLDLQVGGEGMKGFYDDILPKFLNKYAKKWDAKAGMTEIPVFNARTGEKTEPVHYIDITPKMRESVMTKGQPMFAVGAGGAGAAATQQEEVKAEPKKEQRIRYDASGRRVQ